MFVKILNSKNSFTSIYECRRAYWDYDEDELKIHIENPDEDLITIILSKDDQGLVNVYIMNSNGGTVDRIEW